MCLLCKVFIRDNKQPQSDTVKSWGITKHAKIAVLYLYHVCWSFRGVQLRLDNVITGQLLVWQSTSLALVEDWQEKSYCLNEVLKPFAVCHWRSGNMAKREVLWSERPKCNSLTNMQNTVWKTTTAHHSEHTPSLMVAGSWPYSSAGTGILAGVWCWWEKNGWHWTQFSHGSEYVKWGKRLETGPWVHPPTWQLP